jgi:hypothetical protein
MTLWQPSVPLIEFADMLGRGLMVMCAALLIGAAAMLAAREWENDDA